MARLAKNEVQVIETKPNGAIPPFSKTKRLHRKVWPFLFWKVVDRGSRTRICGRGERDLQERFARSDAQEARLSKLSGPESTERDAKEM